MTLLTQHQVLVANTCLRCWAHFQNRVHVCGAKAMHDLTDLPLIDLHPTICHGDVGHGTHVDGTPLMVIEGSYAKGLAVMLNADEVA